MAGDELSQSQIDRLLTSLAFGEESRLKAFLRQIRSRLVRARRHLRRLAWRRYNVEGPLREIGNTLQIKGLPHRRWFANSQFDLIVEDDDGEVVGFETCCRQDGSLFSSFGWDKELGTTNDIGSECESGFLKNKRSILSSESVADIFHQAAVGLPEPIAEMVFMHLRNHEFNEATASFLDSLASDERAEIHRRAEALWQRRGDRKLEEKIILRGEVYWLQASGAERMNVPTHGEMNHIQDIVTSNAHRAALRRWKAAQKPNGFRYGEPFHPDLLGSAE